jgi:pyruvate/2-oxoacid:ferredoxin oxidoreductase beta subunit
VVWCASARDAVWQFDGHNSACILANWGNAAPAQHADDPLCTTFTASQGQLAMTCGNAYVARVAMGANDTQTLKAFLEAESYDGPALIVAYSHCIAHGYDLRYGLEQQKKAGPVGSLAALSFRPARRLHARFESAESAAGGVAVRRNSIPHADSESAGGGEAPARARRREVQTRYRHCEQLANGA